MQCQCGKWKSKKRKAIPAGIRYSKVKNDEAALALNALIDWGIPAETICQAIGVSPRRLTNIRNGRSEPTASQAEFFVSALMNVSE